MPSQLDTMPVLPGRCSKHGALSCFDVFFFWGGGAVFFPHCMVAFPTKKIDAQKYRVACFANFGTWFEKAAPIVTHTHTYTQPSTVQGLLLLRLVLRSVKSL